MATRLTDAPQLWGLEAALSEPRFAGVPLGSTLGDIYINDLFLGKSESGLRVWLAERVQEEFHLRRPIRELRGPRRQLGKEAEGRFLLTLQRDEPRYTGLVYPVIEALGGENCALISRPPQKPSGLPGAVVYLSWGDLPRLNFAAWRREFSRVRQGLNAALAGWARQVNLSRSRLVRLRHTLAVQAQRVWACGEFLRELKPRAVLAEYDRNFRSSCLVLAANRLGIPTATQVHGAVNPPYGYTPVLADVVYCWGDKQRESLTRMGAPPEKLMITGCPRLSRVIEAARTDARRKVGIGEQSLVALLATNPIGRDDKLRLAEEFCRGVGADARFTPVLRLHPSETVDEYAPSLRAKYPGVIITASRQWSLDESLAASDVVVVRDSGFGNDALIKGKPVVVFNPPGSGGELANGRQLAEEGGCPLVTEASALAGELERIIYLNDYRRAIEGRREGFVLDYCRAFGADAARAIAGDLGQRAGRTAP